MKRYYHIIVAVLLPVLIVLLTGCTERKLSLREHPKMDIVLTWPGDTEIEGADVFIYDSVGRLCVQRHSPKEGCSECLPEGEYTVLVGNSDMIDVFYKDVEDWRQCTLNAHPQDYDENLYKQVYHAYCIGQTGIVHDRHNGTTTVRMSPQNRVRDVVLRVSSKKIQDLEELRLMLSGVIQSVRLYDGSDPRDSSVIIDSDLDRMGLPDLPDHPSSITRADQDSVMYYTSNLSVFGWKGKNELTVELIYNDGSRETSYPVDITEDLAALSDPENPDPGIEIETEITTPTGKQLGLKISVNDWREADGSGDIVL